MTRTRTPSEQNPEMAAERQCAGPTARVSTLLNAATGLSGGAEERDEPRRAGVSAGEFFADRRPVIAGTVQKFRRGPRRPPRSRRPRPPCTPAAHRSASRRAAEAVRGKGPLRKLRATLQSAQDRAQAPGAQHTGGHAPAGVRGYLGRVKAEGREEMRPARRHRKRGARSSSSALTTGASGAPGRRRAAAGGDARRR